MIQSVLILHSDPDAARALGSYFSKRGDLVHQTSDEAQARTILENENPSLALIDLHLPGDTALAVIAHIRQDHSATRLIVTNKEPDVRLEMFAREQGAQVFLRAPFTPDWIERALERLEIGKQAQSQSTDHKRVVPRVRFPVQAKITLPYVLLAIAFVLASAFLASRYILESLQERFTNQLIDAGKLSTDWMVQEENRILETVRLLAHSEGMAQAVRERDADSLRKFALPVAINYEEETIEILDLQGTSLLSLHHRSGEDMTAYDASQGDRSFANLEPSRRYCMPKSMEAAINTRERFGSMERRHSILQALSTILQENWSE